MSACYETSSATPKTDTFLTTRVLMVRICRKGDIFDGMSMKEAIIDDIPDDNEENFEGGGEITIRF